LPATARPGTPRASGTRAGGRRARARRPQPTDALKGGEYLRPDRNHADEQGERRQRRRFLDNCTHHLILLEQNENIVPYPFCSVKGYWLLSILVALFEFGNGPFWLLS